MLSERDLPRDALLVYLAKRKSPGACAALELFATMFGFSGIGVVYAGRMTLGMLIMFTYWTGLIGGVCTGRVDRLLLVWPFWVVLVAISAAQAARQRNAALLIRLAGGGA